MSISDHEMSLLRDFCGAQGVLNACAVPPNDLCVAVSKVSDEIDHLRAELRAYTDLQLILAQPTENGAFEMRFRTAKEGLLASMAAILLRALKDEGAQNYCEFNIEINPAAQQEYPDLEAVLVTVQRKAGESPGAQNTRLRAENDRLRVVAVAAQELCEYRGCGEPPPSYFDVLRSSLAALDAKEVQR
jgi:hypothetical protein